MYNEFYIYKFLDEDNNIIYIGRTNDIKRRIIKEHFTALGHLPLECYKSISRIEYSKIENESEQVAYEAILINKLKPKYNSQFKDSANFNVVLPNLKWAEFVFPTEHMLYYLKNRKDKTQPFSDFVLKHLNNFIIDENNLKFGFDIFDKLTPVLDTDLILVASDIVEDNTLYALNICSFISRNFYKKILYINLKEDGEILTQRLIARASHIPLKNLLTANLSEDEFN